MLCLRMLALAGLLFLWPSFAVADVAGWFIKPYVGLSEMSDTDGRRTGSTNQAADVSVDGGFVSGLAVGYRYNERWAAELAWEYRSNDTETVYRDGTLFDDGNYASNIFYLNGYYYFPVESRWEPYIGAGVGWVQEIDIDLEGNGPEQSFSGDGDVAFQIMIGADYRWTERWSLSAELRYSALSNVDMSAEGGALGDFDGLDYEPLSATISVSYRF